VTETIEPPTRSMLAIEHCYNITVTTLMALCKLRYVELVDLTACQAVGQLHTSIDVFSFSMIICELATLQDLRASLGFNAPPYDRNKMALEILGGKRPDREDVVRSCGEVMARLLEQCWSPVRAVRPSFGKIKVRNQCWHSSLTAFLQAAAQLSPACFGALRGKLCITMARTIYF
jgi:hypothetical protein